MPIQGLLMEINAQCLQSGQRVQVNGPRWRRVSLALLDVLRRSGPATVVRSCSEMPLFRPGNAPRSAMGSVPIKSVNLNSLPWLAILCGVAAARQLPAGANKVAGVAGRIALEVVLMLRLRLPEVARRREFRDDLAR